VTVADRPRQNRASLLVICSEIQKLILSLRAPAGPVLVPVAQDPKRRKL
jgi:hypothetical protein